MADKKENVKQDPAPEKKAEASTPAPETFSVAEIVEASSVLFPKEKMQPYLVEAAFKHEPKKRFTLDEARKIVRSFADRKVGN